MKGLRKPFNLSNINRVLLTELESQIRDKDHEDLRNQATTLANQASLKISPS
jgi:hypothetical protein